MRLEWYLRRLESQPAVAGDIWYLKKTTGPIIAD